MPIGISQVLRRQRVGEAETRRKTEVQIPSSAAKNKAATQQGGCFVFRYRVGEASICLFRFCKGQRIAALGRDSQRVAVDDVGDTVKQNVLVIAQILRHCQLVIGNLPSAGAGDAVGYHFAGTVLIEGHLSLGAVDGSLPRAHQGVGAAGGQQGGGPYQKQQYSHYFFHTIVLVSSFFSPLCVELPILSTDLGDFLDIPAAVGFNRGINTENEVSDMQYFVDALNGRDDNDGRTPLTPWQTLDKIIVCNF